MNKQGTSAVKIGVQIESLLQDAKEKEIQVIKDESKLEAIEVMNMPICNDKKRKLLEGIAENQRLRVNKVNENYK